MHAIHHLFLFTVFVRMDQALVRFIVVPLGVLLGAGGECQQVDGGAQDVGQAVQLTLRQVEGVERVICLQELYKVTGTEDSFGHCLGFVGDFNLMKHVMSLREIVH